MNTLLRPTTLFVIFTLTNCCNIKNFIPTTVYSVISIPAGYKNGVTKLPIRHLYLRYTTNPTSTNCQTLFIGEIDLLHIIVKQNDLEVFKKAEISPDDSLALATHLLSKKLKLSTKPLAFYTKDFSVLSGNFNNLTNKDEIDLKFNLETKISNLITKAGTQTPLKITFGSPIQLNPDYKSTVTNKDISELDFDFLKFQVYFNTEKEKIKNDGTNKNSVGMVRFANSRITDTNIKQKNYLQTEGDLYEIFKDINTNKFFRNLIAMNVDGTQLIDVLNLFDKLDKNEADSGELRLVTDELLELIENNSIDFWKTYKYTNQTIKNKNIDDIFGTTYFKSNLKTSGLYDGSMMLKLYIMSNTNELQEYRQVHGKMVGTVAGNQSSGKQTDNSNNNGMDNGKKKGIALTVVLSITAGVIVVSLIILGVIFYLRKGKKLNKWNKRALKTVKK